MWNELKQRILDFDPEGPLHRVGLARYRPTPVSDKVLLGVASFAFGILAGVGLGLFAVPPAYKKLRDRMERKEAEDVFQNDIDLDQNLGVGA
jgi:hypothetical protein